MKSEKGLVVLIHGIRDYALWHTVIRKELESSDYSVELTNYGRFDVLRFLLPISFFRKSALRRLERQIKDIRRRNPDKRLFVIAHSFGTYLVSKLLEDDFSLKIDRVIFCGSVVRYDFPFENFAERYDPPILNEVGSRDIWPAVAESVTLGYGSAGTYGFRRPGVRDRWHNDAGHGFFLNSEFCRKYWIPFLDHGRVVEGSETPQPPRLWVRIISIFPLKILATLALLVLLTLGVFRFHSSLFAEEVVPSQVDNWNSYIEKTSFDFKRFENTPLPGQLQSQKADFERWWRNSGVADRSESAPADLFRALSTNAEIYRSVEYQSSQKPQTQFWYNECVRHFREIGVDEYQARCLLDLSEVFYDLTQQNNTNAEAFRAALTEAHRVFVQIESLNLTNDLRAELAYMRGKTQYSAARPQSFDLSGNWDEELLLSSLRNMEEANRLAPNVLRNLTQLARTTQRLAFEFGNDDDPLWTERLANAQAQMQLGFLNRRDELTSAYDFTPPANILSVLSLDLATREWLLSSKDEEAARSSIGLLETTAIPLQREIVQRIMSTTWRDSFGFDVRYDLGRMHLLRASIQDELGLAEADQSFERALRAFEGAAARATLTQSRAALNSISTETLYQSLGAERLERVRGVFRTGDASDNQAS